jgi:hypothetical protein
MMFDVDGSRLTFYVDVRRKPFDGDGSRWTSYVYVYV